MRKKVSQYKGFNFRPAIAFQLRSPPLSEGGSSPLCWHGEAFPLEMFRCFLETVVDLSPGRFLRKWQHD